MGRHARVEMGEEGQEFLAAMLRLALADDCTDSDIVRGQQGGGAVAEVIVRDALDVAEPHGEDGLGSL